MNITEGKKEGRETINEKQFTEVALNAQRDTEQKLKESEEKFRELFNNMSSGVAVYEPINDGEDFIFKDFNLACERIEKTRKEEVIGKKVTEVFPGVKDFGLFEVFQRVWKSGKPEHYPISLYQDDRITGWRDNYIYKLPAGELVAVYDDVTEQKLSEQKLKESEEGYRLFLENFQGIAYLTEFMNFTPIFFYGSVEDITGYSSNDFIQRKVLWNKLIHPEDLPRFIEKGKELTSNMDKAANIEYRIINKNGDIKWVFDTGKCRFNDSGNLFMQGGVYDITERKQSEQKLKESEEKYRILFESSPVGIGISDFEGNIHSLNQAMEEITGYDLESQKQTNLRSTYVNPDDRIKLFKKLKETGSVRNYYVKLRKRDGTIYDVLLNIDTISIANKEFFITNIQDISERTKVEKELKRLSKLKSELLTRTSHELKTPAMHIKGYADLLLYKYKENLGIDELQIIRHIKKGVLRLETLIYDILHNAELDSGQCELNKVHSDLSSLLELSVRELKAFSAFRGHSIFLDIHNKLMVSFDKDQIRHVINHLLTNAIKYTPLNGVIGINSTITDDYITIAIQDNGIGLSEDQISGLFTKFGKIERFGQGFDIITEGSGLGLQITKKIIEMHGGKIWAESGGINRGSTFYFSLPR